MGKNEELETLDLDNTNETKEEKVINATLEGVSEENIKDTILSEDLEKKIENENLEEKLMTEDNPVDNVFGEEFVGLDNLGNEEEKPKKKKSILPLVIILIILILIASLGFCVYRWNDSNNESLKEAMEEPALDYFDKYMSVGTGASAYTVTLKELKEANSNNGEDYKLDIFDKCDDEKTQATIKINYANGKVDNIEVKLNCKFF